MPDAVASSNSPAAAVSAGMREIRLVGRGGGGIVTAGELLGQAAVEEGRHAQSIPTFGPERRGALSMCTLRISAEPILLKCSSTQPDVLVVFDPTIWHHANITLGLAEGGLLIFNSPQTAAAVEDDLRSGRHGYELAPTGCRFLTLDATRIALDCLGRAITNTTMMGALSGATGLPGMPALRSVLEQRFGDRAEANIRAAETGHDLLQKGGD